MTEIVGTISQPLTALLLIISGGAAGLLYTIDVFFRKYAKKKQWLIILIDSLYSVVAGGMLILASYIIDMGRIRGYTFLCFAIGIVIARVACKLLSRLVIKVLHSNKLIVQK